MHEFSLTSQLVQAVLSEAEKHGATRVVEVHVAIGRLTFLGVDQVRFAYHVLAKNTAMEGSQLVVESVDGRVRCDDCGYTGPIGELEDPAYHITVPTLACPRCEAAVEVTGGREFMIRYIKVTG
jgi:hydrogenase nickel incorporation protein HypA/HybF